MSGLVYVEIYNFKTGEVAERMGPMTEWTAERIERGASINMDHSSWTTRRVPAEDNSND